MLQTRLYNACLYVLVQDQTGLASGSWHEQWCPGCQVYILTSLMLWACCSLLKLVRSVGVHLCFSKLLGLKIREFWHQDLVMSSDVLDGCWVYILYYIEQYHLCSCIHLFAEACQECWVHLFVSTYNWNLSLSLSIADFVIHSMNQVSRRIKHNRRLQPLICMLQMYIWSFESFHQYCIVQANTDCSCPRRATKTSLFVGLSMT